MEVKIGVLHASRELVIDSNQSADDLEKQIAKAVGDSGGVLTLTDSKGRTIVVPSEKLAYVEIGGNTAGQVGFRS